MQSYKHLTFGERVRLSENLKKGNSLREIARKLNRNVSSISSELKRNKNIDGLLYNSLESTILYINRRKKCIRRPLFSDNKVHHFVCDGLSKYWSPEFHTIHQRPKAVELRTSWKEIQYMEALEKGVLVTFVDRTSRKLYTICRPVFSMAAWF